MDGNHIWMQIALFLLLAGGVILLAAIPAMVLVVSLAV
jgi:hypothetical protein